MRNFRREYKAVAADANRPRLVASPRPQGASNSKLKTLNSQPADGSGGGSRLIRRRSP